MKIELIVALVMADVAPADDMDIITGLGLGQNRKERENGNRDGAEISMETAQLDTPGLASDM